MATENATGNPVPNGFVGSFRVVRYGVAALFAASIVNVLVLQLGLAAFELPSEFVGGPFGPLAVGPVVVNSAIAAVGATVAYGIVVRYSARPNRTFAILAGAVLVLSFGMFLAPDLSGAPLGVFGVLAVMYVTAAITIVGILTRIPIQAVE